MKTFLICLSIVIGLVWVSNRPKDAALAPQIAVVPQTSVKASKVTAKPEKINYTKIARFIERHEGFRSKPYYDRVGVRTVGYGTLANHPMTRHQARLALRARIQRDYDVLIKYTSRDTALVLCSFAYNCGLEKAVKIAKSHNIERIKYYVNAGGKKLAGLKTRRAQELALLK